MHSLTGLRVGLIVALLGCAEVERADPSAPVPGTSGGSAATTSDALCLDAGSRESDMVGCSRMPKLHRVINQECDRERAPGFLRLPAPEGTCRADAECTQGENGRCTPGQFYGMPECTYDQCFCDAMC
ncbi:MAG TPA: hypothetical protein VJR89_19500, partial [Polyangiales bacterium]|nr:hypothetical protein [Polyangiales bacterium]